MMKTLKLLSTIAAIGMLAGCAFGQQHMMTAAQPTIQATGSGSLGVAAHDQRPYVISGDKTPMFVGLQRGGYGNPFDVTTGSNAPLADDLAQVMANTLDRSGFDVQVVSTQTSQSRARIVSELTGGDSRAVLLTIRELKSDTYTNAAFIYDLTLDVLGKDGAVLAQSKVQGEDNLGGSFMNPTGHASQAVPVAMEKKLEQLLNDPAVVRALGQ